MGQIWTLQISQISLDNQILLLAVQILKLLIKCFGILWYVILIFNLALWYYFFILHTMFWTNSTALIYCLLCFWHHKVIYLFLIWQLINIYSFIFFDIAYLTLCTSCAIWVLIMVATASARILIISTSTRIICVPIWVTLIAMQAFMTLASRLTFLGHRLMCIQCITR